MVKDHQNLIVGLDIGTSKTMAIVASVDPEKGLEVLGYGMDLSHGLRRGAVIDIESTTRSIQNALSEAEIMAKCKISEVFIAVSGSHIESRNSEGTVAVKERSEITQFDIDRALELARAVPIPNDHVILHCIPQEYTVDGQEGIKNPLGMSGARLTVKAHVVTAAQSAVDNLEKCVRRSGVEVIGNVTLQPLAAARAVLTDDEKDIGVCLVDIGGGTADVAIYTGGAIRYTAVIPIAGDQITSDIVTLLRTPTKDAENIKVMHGCALSQMADQNDFFEVPGVAGREARRLSRHALAEVIEPRTEELFGFVQDELKRSGYSELISAGVVLTGGSAQLSGMTELGEEVFHLPVRIGMPRYEGPLADMVKNPRFAVGAGLLLEGKDYWMKDQLARQNSSGIAGFFHRVKEWFKDNF
jgi:cell division protein FtsA